MIFDIDKKDEVSIAIIDDSGSTLTYSQLAGNIHEISSVLQERELIFCLCENKAASLLGFLSFYDHKDVCLLLSSHIDRELLQSLQATYHPSYFWMPESLISEFGYSVVYNTMGY